MLQLFTVTRGKYHQQPVCGLILLLMLLVLVSCREERRRTEKKPHQMLKTMKSVFVLQPPSEFLVLVISWNCGKLPIVEDDFRPSIRSWTIWRPFSGTDSLDLTAWGNKTGGRFLLLLSDYLTHPPEWDPHYWRGLYHFSTPQCILAHLCPYNIF